MQKFLESDWGRIARFVIGVGLMTVALANTLPLSMTLMIGFAGLILVLVAWSGACPLFAVKPIRALEKRFKREGEPGR